MSKATTVKELINSLDMNPLSNLDNTNLRDFYVDTAPARGDDTIARVEYILKNGGRRNKKFLFAGHTGSGKSTELFKLTERIKDDYLVVCFSVADYVTFMDVSCVDVILSMLKSLVDVIEKKGLEYDEECLDKINNFWKENIKVTSKEEEDYLLEAEAGAKASLCKILSIKIKALFKQSNTIKKESVTIIEKTLSDFIELINKFILSIKEKLGDKELLIIVDDLDKLGEEEAYDVFKNHAIMLTSIEANVIYTFPVYMHYNKDYRYISMNFDESVILSIIMVHEANGQPFRLGYDTLEQIVLKRADRSLFEDGCINDAIIKSGGSIRSMLQLLRSASINAGLRYNSEHCDDDCQIVTKGDFDKAYREHKNSMKRAITQKYMSLLREVYKTKNTVTETEDDLVMDMFKTFSIIEYNCDRWCDLNPAVLDYLVEIKEIEVKAEETNGE